MSEDEWRTAADIAEQAARALELERDGLKRELEEARSMDPKKRIEVAIGHARRGGMPREQVIEAVGNALADFDRKATGTELEQPAKVQPDGRPGGRKVQLSGTAHGVGRGKAGRPVQK